MDASLASKKLSVEGSVQGKQIHSRWLSAGLRTCLLQRGKLEVKHKKCKHIRVCVRAWGPSPAHFLHINSLTEILLTVDLWKAAQGSKQTKCAFREAVIKDSNLGVMSALFSWPKTPSCNVVNV